MTASNRHPLFCALTLILALSFCACSGGASISDRQDELHSALAATRFDTLRLHRDWRMGSLDTLRAGTALFFRFSWLNNNEDEPRELSELHLVNREGAQYPLELTPRVFHGDEKSVCIISVAAEQSFYLPAGLYYFAAEGRFTDETAFKTNYIECKLLDTEARISESAKLNERERFAAYLLFTGEEESFDNVIHVLLENLKSEEGSQASVLTRLLQNVHTSRQQNETGARLLKVDSVLDLAADSSLSTYERELSIFALEELYFRSQEKRRKSE